MTERSAPGSDSDASRPFPLSSAWPTRNEVKLAASMVTKHCAGEDAEFGPQHGSRRGTTVNDERIIPVLYSPLISSTPRTPIASCAKKVPVNEVEIAVAPGSKPPG